MRLALIVGSSYEKNGKLAPIPSAEVDGDLVERRLIEPDAGFRVVRFEAERGLAERVEQRLLAQTEVIDELLVYFSGYSVLSSERGPALLLDGDRLGTFSVTRLKNLFAHFARSACLIVDAAAVVESGQPLSSLAEALGTTLTEGTRHISAMVAVRDSAHPDSFGGSAFTGLVLMTLDWLGASRINGEVLDVRRLFDGVREEQLFREIPAANLFGGALGFPILMGTPGSSEAQPSSLPRFDLEPGSELDGLLNLGAKHPSEEPKTLPGVSPPEDEDEVTPTFRRATRSDRPPQDRGLSRFELAGGDDTRAGPLPSFEEPSGLGSNGGSEPLPSFELASAPSEGEAPRERILPSFEAHGSPAEDTRADSVPAFTDAADRVDAPTSTTVATARAESLGLPSFGPSAAADELAAAGRDEEALAEFEAALTLSSSGPDRAGLLARFARVLGRTGRGQQAAERFAEAVQLDALNLDVLAVRAEWAAAATDFDNLLRTSEAWLGFAPEEPRALEYLARAAEATGDDQRAFDAQRRLGRLSSLPEARRAQALEEASRIAEHKLADRALAERMTEEALELAPADANLLGHAEALHGAEGHPDQLFVDYERALDQSPDAGTAAQLCDKLQRLAREKLGEPLRAAPAFERALARHPEDIQLRQRLVELYAEVGDLARSIEHCRALSRLSPLRAAVYRRAQSLFEAAGESDGAWNAASVLESLGEADINESLLADQHKPDGLLAARSTIQGAEWSNALYTPAYDPALARIFFALGPAAVRVGIGLAKHKNRFTTPDPSTLQDAEKSTTTLAKTLVWTSRLLGFAPPQLYVLPELSAGLAIAPQEQAGALVSRSLGSGLALGQLAFLWARLLPQFLDEFRALPLFPSPAELSALLSAAFALGGAQGVDVRSLDGDAKRLYAALRRELRGPALEGLGRVVRGIPSEEIPARAERALRHLELVGVRAGLLVSADVGVGAELIRRFPIEGVTRAETQLSELHTFAISAEYATLREKIGVAIGTRTG